jgi:hypothetical protein
MPAPSCPLLSFQTPTRRLLQSGATSLLPLTGPASLASISGLSFNQLLSDPALLAIARANGYSSVSALFPGIGAFTAEVGAGVLAHTT